ncbi:MAG: cbb3-type cytochrome c oxidase subunit 3 [Candidatus Zixiibacteriota bacterium]
MFKDIIGQIEGSELYSIVAMLLLVAAFVAIIIRVIRMDRRHLAHMERLPLDPVASGDRHREDRHV